MKRVITLMFFTIIMIGQVIAQDVKQKEAKVLLDQVSANFKTFTSFKATFTMLMESPATNMKEQYTGDMTAQGDKFKLVLNGKAAKEIYNNGTTLWTYFPGEEVTISDVDGENEMFSISKLVNMYQKGYKYMVEGTETIAGKSCQIVVLTPEVVNGQSSHADIFKVRLWIDPKTKQIVSWRIFEKNGNRYTTTVSQFTPNVPVTPATFVFDTKAHKGIEINDMRE